VAESFSYRGFGPLETLSGSDTVPLPTDRRLATPLAAQILSTVAGQLRQGWRTLDSAMNSPVGARVESGFFALVEGVAMWLEQTGAGLSDWSHAHYCQCCRVLRSKRDTKC